MTTGKILGVLVLKALKLKVHSNIETSEIQAYFPPPTVTLIIFMRSIKLTLFSLISLDYSNHGTEDVTWFWDNEFLLQWSHDSLSCLLPYNGKRKLGWPFLNEKWCSKHVRHCELTRLQCCVQMQMEPYKCSLPNHPLFFKNNWNTSYSFWTTSASHLVGFLLMQNHHLMKWMEEAGRSINSIKNKMTESNETLSSELKHLACFYL